MIRDTAAMDRPLDGTPRVRRRLFVVGGVFVLTAAAAAVFAPMTRRWSAAQVRVDVSRLRLGAVTQGDLVRDVHVMGRLVSASHPTLFSVAPGIVNVEVRPGERVKKAQALATIDSPTLESQLKQEEATLYSLVSDYERQKIVNRQENLTNRQKAELARVNHEAAERELRIAEQLHVQGFIPDLELATAQDDAARAKLERGHAEQTLVQQKNRLVFELRDRKQRVERQRYVVEEITRRVGALEILSPVDGLVGELFVEDRDAVDERRPVLKVVDLSVFEIDLEIPEGYAEEVFVDAEAEFKIGSTLCPGRVTRVAPSVTAGRVSGTATFVGELPGGLRQNQRVDVRIVLDKRAAVVKAPRGAYVDAGGRYAYVIRGGVAVRTAIEIGARGVREIEVIRGLFPGDQIVLSDLTEFKDAPSILLD